jgi:hypothetical protein
MTADRVASLLHLMHHSVHTTAPHSCADAVEEMTRHVAQLAQLLDVVLPPIDDDDAQPTLPLDVDDDDTEVCDECDAAVPTTGSLLSACHAPTCSLHSCDAACDHVNPRERGDDDGVEYADPRDARDGVA